MKFLGVFLRRSGDWLRIPGEKLHNILIASHEQDNFAYHILFHYICLQLMSRTSKC